MMAPTVEGFEIANVEVAMVCRSRSRSRSRKRNIFLVFPLFPPANEWINRDRSIDQPKDVQIGKHPTITSQRNLATAQKPEN